MTAAEWLSPSQFVPEHTNLHEPGVQLPMFMTPHEIGGMMSGDYHVNMRHVPEEMRDRYEHERRRDELRGYTWGKSPMERISDKVREEGGVTTPAKVIHLPSGVSALYDGHHHAVAAMEQNKLLPVDHYFDHREIMRDVERDRRI